MSTDLDERLALLKRSYAASFPAKRAEFATALQAAASEAGIAQLRDLAHKLAGSGASYGFAELSRLAKRVETAAIARLEGAADADVEGACKALLTALETEANG